MYISKKVISRKPVVRSPRIQFLAFPRKIKFVRIGNVAFSFLYASGSVCVYVSFLEEVFAVQALLINSISDVIIHLSRTLEGVQFGYNSEDFQSECRWVVRPNVAETYSAEIYG